MDNISRQEWKKYTDVISNSLVWTLVAMGGIINSVASLFVNKDNDPALAVVVLTVSILVMVLSEWSSWKNKKKIETLMERSPLSSHQKIIFKNKEYVLQEVDPKSDMVKAKDNQGETTTLFKFEIYNLNLSKGAENTVFIDFIRVVSVLTMGIGFARMARLNTENMFNSYEPFLFGAGLIMYLFYIYYSRQTLKKVP